MEHGSKYHKYIIVNIQESGVFDCQRLNRYFSFVFESFSIILSIIISHSILEIHGQIKHSKNSLKRTLYFGKELEYAILSSFYNEKTSINRHRIWQQNIVNIIQYRKILHMFQ